MNLRIGNSWVLLAVAALTLAGPGGLRAALPPVAGPASFPSDDAFLDYVEHQTFNFFWNEANPSSGLIRDRSQPNSPCSIASVGFGLSAINIAVERGWLTREQGRARVLATLQTLSSSPQGPGAAGVSGYHGWFYHFLDMTNGLRFGGTELSTIDTTLLMLGVIDVGQFFDDLGDPSEALIRQLSDGLLNRLDWSFVLRTNDNAVTMQWTPEGGFSSAGWVGYSEASCMYLLGLGAATNPLPIASWDAWTSGYAWTTAYGYSFVSCPPLFTHQYSQAWIDFRWIADAYFRAKGSDYFENSRRATLAQQQYALRNPRAFPNYGFNEWGLTACDGPGKVIGGVTYLGYVARGAPAGTDDGTIAPTAVMGSLPFAPDVCLAAARHIYDAYRTNIWTSEGFRDAYNVQANWWDGDTIGIDEGPIVLMIENNRTGSVWRRMMRSAIIQRGLARAAFTAPPPEQTTLTTLATNQLLVSWSGPPSYQSGFQVLTSLDGANFALAATVGSNVFSVVLPVLPGATYFVRVITTNAAGLSRPRQTVCVTIPASNPLSSVSLLASDAPGTSSFASAGNWSNAFPPGNGFDYLVSGPAGGGNGYALRTPADGVSRVFAGNSLTIGDGTGRWPPSQLFLGGASCTNTVADLRLDGGAVIHGSPGAALTLSGGAAIQNGGVTFEQGAFNDRYYRVDATLQGGGPVTVSQAANGAASATPSYPGCVEFTKPNTFLGPVFVIGSSLVGDLASLTGPATLRVSALNNGGLTSNLGQSARGPSNLVLNAGILQYVGPGSTSDRLFTIGTLGAGLDASGSGPLRLSNRGPVGLSGVGARTLLLSGTNTAHNTLAAALSDYGGPTSILKTNSGTWVLSGSNSCSGQATLGAGTLVLNGASPLGGPQTLLLNAGTLILSNGVASSPVVAAGGSLRFSGSNSTNVVSGLLTIAAPTLNINGQTGVGADGATLLLAGGVSAANRNLEIFDDLNGDPGRVWLVGKPLNLGTGELQGFGLHIAVSGNVVGTIHPYYGRRMTLETNNAFLGAPALYLGNPSWGRLDLNGHSLIINRLTNTLSQDEVTSATKATLTVANSTSNTYSGRLTGLGLALNKTAGGRLTLAGTNTYSGPTTLISGTLALSAPPGPSAILASSPVINVGNGTVFDVSGVGSGFSLAAGQTLKGSGTVNGPLAAAAGATLAPGDPAVAAINSLSFNHNLTLLSGSTTVVHVATSPVANDVIKVLGGLKLSGTLVLNNIGSTPFAAGNSFTLLVSTNGSGEFSGILPAIPGPGLVWDTTRLAQGTLAVALLTLKFDSLLLLGTNLIIAGSGGWPNRPFYVLGSTNIDFPLGQWQLVTAGYFDGAGNFIFSNAIDPSSPREFFRLGVP